MSMKRETIKKAMLERMDELGMNIATLAREAGLSYDTPRDFLVRDKSGMPAADKMVAMLQALNLTHLLIDASEASNRNGLQAMRRRRGYTLEQLAARLPRGNAKELKKLEAGGPLSYEWKTKLAEALECHPDDLNPRLGGIGAKTKVSGFHDPSTAWKGKESKKRKGKRAIVSEGGWTVEHEAFLPGVPHEFIGKLCVVKLEDKHILIRRVQPGSQPGYYTLETIHPGTKPIKDAFVVASALVVVMTQQ